MARYLDVTRTYLYWRGAPGGVPRAVAGLSDAGLRAGVRLVVFHPLRRRWYEIPDARGLHGEAPERGLVAGSTMRGLARLRHGAGAGLARVPSRTAGEPAGPSWLYTRAQLLGHDTSGRLRDLTTLGEEVTFATADQMLLVELNLTNLPGYAGALDAARVAHRLSVVALVHDVLPMADPSLCNPRHVEQFRRWFAYLAQIADRTVTNSDQVAAAVRTLLPAMPVHAARFGSILDVPNALRARPLPEIVTALRGHAALVATGAPPDRPWILSVGPLAPHKNHICQLDALEPLWEQGVLQAPLVLAGRSGAAAARVRRRIDGSPVLRRNVVILGEVPDETLWDLYRGAMLTVLSSSYEGFGLPISESLQFGTPCFAADVGGTREVAGEHVSYFHPNAPSQLRDLVERFVTDPSFASAARQRARAFRPYSWDETLLDLTTAPRISDPTAAAAGSAAPAAGSSSPGAGSGASLGCLAVARAPSRADGAPLGRPRDQPVIPPIDAVYTWSDGSLPPSGLWSQLRWWRPRRAPEGAWAQRFRDNGELRYSLRSLEAHAPWIRTIHVVTNGNVPGWLDTAHPRIRVVTHTDIFEDAHDLPTFNSLAIECNLHRIPGLAEHFLYFNDDCFLGNDLPAQSYFSSNGRPVFHVDSYGFPTPGWSLGRIHCMLTGREDLTRRMLRHNHGMLRARYGRVPTPKRPSHTPQMYQCSALTELVAEWKTHVAQTVQNPIRGPRDTFLAALYANSTSTTADRAPRHVLRPLIQGSCYRFFTARDGNADDLPALLDELLQTRPTFFCLNDAIDSPHIAERYRVVVGQFLERYFPRPSTFELDTAAARRSTLPGRTTAVTSPGPCGGP